MLNLLRSKHTGTSSSSSRPNHCIMSKEATFYCYGCGRNMVPTYCNNVLSCPHCQSDFVESLETSVTNDNNLSPAGTLDTLAIRSITTSQIPAPHHIASLNTNTSTTAPHTIGTDKLAHNQPYHTGRTIPCDGPSTGSHLSHSTHSVPCTGPYASTGNGSAMGSRSYTYPTLDRAHTGTTNQLQPYQLPYLTGSKTQSQLHHAGGQYPAQQAGYPHQQYKHSQSQSQSQTPILVPTYATTNSRSSVHTQFTSKQPTQQPKSSTFHPYQQQHQPSSRSMTQQTTVSTASNTSANPALQTASTASILTATSNTSATSSNQSRRNSIDSSQRY